MFCPNCATTFVLRADYADHIQQCRPSDIEVDARDAVLARLNAAASRLQADFGDVPPSRRTLTLHSAACERVSPTVRRLRRLESA